MLSDSQLILVTDLTGVWYCSVAAVTCVRLLETSLPSTAWSSQWVGRGCPAQRPTSPRIGEVDSQVWHPPTEMGLRKAN